MKRFRRRGVGWSEVEVRVQRVGMGQEMFGV